MYEIIEITSDMYWINSKLPRHVWDYLKTICDITWDNLKITPKKGSYKNTDVLRLCIESVGILFSLSH